MVGDQEQPNFHWWADDKETDSQKEEWCKAPAKGVQKEQ